jgi:hypothetical protein
VTSTPHLDLPCLDLSVVAWAGATERTVLRPVVPGPRREPVPGGDPGRDRDSSLSLVSSRARVTRAARTIARLATRFTFK